MSEQLSDPFTRGDHIEVTAKRSTPDFGTLRGTALDTRGIAGRAAFRLELATGPLLSDKAVLDLNLNEVHVKRLFSADVARRPGPV